MFELRKCLVVSSMSGSDIYSNIMLPNNERTSAFESSVASLMSEHPDSPVAVSVVDVLVDEKHGYEIELDNVGYGNGRSVSVVQLDRDIHYGDFINETDVSPAVWYAMCEKIAIPKGAIVVCSFVVWDRDGNLVFEVDLEDVRLKDAIYGLNRSIINRVQIPIEHASAPNSHDQEPVTTQRDLYPRKTEPKLKSATTW